MVVVTYDLALVFLLLRFRRRTRFFLHLALILNCCGVSGSSRCRCGEALGLTLMPCDEVAGGRSWRAAAEIEKEGAPRFCQARGSFRTSRGRRQPRNLDGPRNSILAIHLNIHLISTFVPQQLFNMAVSRGDTSVACFVFRTATHPDQEGTRNSRYSHQLTCLLNTYSHDARLSQ